MTARFRHMRHRELNGLDRDRLDHTKDSMEQGNKAGRSTEHVFTATNLTNKLTVVGEDTLAVGNPRVFVDGTDLPLGLEAGTRYWLADDGVNEYTLHPTVGDAAAGTNTVAFTDDGTGTHTLTFL